MCSSCKSNHGNFRFPIFGNAWVGFIWLRSPWTGFGKQHNIKVIIIILRISRFIFPFNIYIAITETYLDKKIDNRQLVIENYKIIRGDRATGQVGGGCLIYISDNVSSSRLKYLETANIKGIWFKISTGKKLL